VRRKWRIDEEVAKSFLHRSTSAKSKKKGKWGRGYGH
jgi:hypothetical protein